MKNIYLISGLGADYRMFQNLELQYYNCTHVTWLDPGAKETIEHYAARLATNGIEPGSIIIGMSFGGMMAIEVSKLIPVEKVVLISSIKTKYEVPFYMRWAGSLGLDKVLPLNTLRQPGLMMDFQFGAETPAERALLAEIIRTADPLFYTWAVHKVLRWQNTYNPPNLYHIHGTADRILPFLFLKKVDYTIKGGGHLMILNRAKKINNILNEILK